MDTPVAIWWASLSAVAVGNVLLWALSTRRLAHVQSLWARRSAHAWLALIYVLVCAFRSIVPRADVQRITLVDSWIASVAVGRSVATVAELAFVVQWALLLDEYGRDARSPVARGIAKAIVPLIVFAECCSWYAVLTTNYIGNAIEESTWALTATLMVIALSSLAFRASEVMRRFLGGVVVVGLAYVAFMVTVDVPMYVNRWIADEAAGRAYLGFAEGWADLTTRWVVTGAWEDWHQEVAWMSGYFSAAVWLSIGAAHAPVWRATDPARQAGLARS